MSVVGTRVQVATTATALVATAGTPGSPGRASSTIFNNGPNVIAIGGDNTVTLAGGFLIPAGAALTIDHDPSDEIYAICSVLQATPADTSVLTESRA